MELGDYISIAVFITGLVGNFIILDRRVTKNQSNIENLQKNSDSSSGTVDKRLDKLEEKLDNIYQILIKK